MPGFMRMLVGKRGGVLLALLIVAAYANTIRAPFIYDDVFTVVENRAIRSVWPLQLNGRPVADLTFKLNYAFGGLSPVGYHVVNLGIHMAAALCLWGVLRRTLRIPRIGLAGGEGAADVVAWLSAAVWALHPVQTQAVTYITQRYESLMALWFLGGMYCAARAFSEESQAGAKGRQRDWLMGCVGCAAFGMATKQVMAVFPVMVFLYDAILISSGYRRAIRRRPLFYGALAGLWLVLWAAASGVAKNMLASGGSGDVLVDRFDYLCAQGVVILQYLRLLVWPVGLTFDYAWPVATPDVWTWLGVLATGALVLLTAVALALRTPAALAGAWFFLILAPTSSVFPLLDAAAEYRVYLPSAALIVYGVACLVRAWPADGIAGRIGPVLASGGVAMLGLASIQRNADYSSERGLWATTVAQVPGNLRARINLGVAHLDAGDYAAARREAIAVLERARDGRYQSSPGFVELYSAHGWNIVGITCEQAGDVDGALHAYERALAVMDGRFEPARQNLSRLRAKLNRTAPSSADGAVSMSQPQ